MRLLSHVELPGDTATNGPASTATWTGITADAALSKTLAELRDPATIAGAAPVDLIATLRPYQQTGVNWLRFMSRLNLGACLADDMGLGKTIQVIALLLHAKKQKGGPSLLVLPASLIGNWKAEVQRFAPTLNVAVVHTSERGGVPDAEPDDLADHDLVVTTYGVLVRTEWLRDRRWRLAILDEAQAIKNSGTRQSKAVKELRAGSPDRPDRHAGREPAVGPVVPVSTSSTPACSARARRSARSSSGRPSSRRTSTARSGRSSARTSCGGSRRTSGSSPTCRTRPRSPPTAG